MFDKSVDETQIQIQIDGPKNYIECYVKREEIVSQKYSFPFHHATITYNLTLIILFVFIPIFWFVGHLADPYTTQSLYQTDGGDGDYEPPGSAGVA